jgi:phosphoketolase
MTLAAQRLQELGVIDYKRRVVHVRDLKQLQQAACECYAAMNVQFDRLFAKPTTVTPTRTVQSV